MSTSKHEAPDQMDISTQIPQGNSLSRFIVKRHRLVFAVIACITVFFAFQIGKVKIVTELNDLLPQDHKYVKLHKEFRDTFGGSSILFIDLFVKEGDIFNTETLKKIAYLTEEIIYLPGADRYKVISVTHPKVKDTRSTDWGLEVRSLIDPIPETEEELEALRKRVYANDMVYGALVSLDSKAALITVEFQEDIPLDYPVIFNKIQELSDLVRDANTNLAIAGDPMVRGYVYSYMDQTKIIFGLTLLAMIALIFIYTRNLQMVFMPLLSGIVSAVWGIGFMGILGYAFDPLSLVVPLLITARTLSHSIQFNERVIEEYSTHKDIRTACNSSVRALFYPGLVGIVTDAAGIAVLIIIPIPFLTKLGIVCTFWALSSIFSVLFLNPAVLVLFPPPMKHGDKDRGIYRKISKKIAMINSGRRSWAVLAVTLIIALIGVFFARELKVGDVNPGSAILWPDSQYNSAARTINKSFLGLNPMLIVFEGEIDDALIKFDVLHKAEAFQRYITKLPSVGGSVSIVDILKRVNMNLNKGNPKWDYLPHEDKHIAGLTYQYFAGTGPGEMDAYCTADNKSMSISVYFKDHRGDTLREGVEATRKFAENNPINGAKLRYCGGVVGTLAASNEVIFRSQVLLLTLSFGLTILLCGLSFRSIVAGILLVIPLAVTNYLIFAYMGMRGVGLNINTLPVATIAIGIGVDYGVYFLSRMKEEYRESQDYWVSMFTALSTTGKAISFTALTVGIGVIFWIWSDIRFQAEMGLLLTLATILHLLGTLILLSALVLTIKPKFLTR